MSKMQGGQKQHGVWEEPHAAKWWPRLHLSSIRPRKHAPTVHAGLLPPDEILRRHGDRFSLLPFALISRPGGQSTLSNAAACLKDI